ncbi:MAG: hypothetical protein J5544_00480, partial [Clostridia bacterium]|nr:hypothetical protein [Clostridia bacterium]
GTVHPALTLAEAPYTIEGQTMAGTATFPCDAVIAYDTASHTKIELAFIQGELTRDQLTAIAASIMLDSEARPNDQQAPTPTPEPTAAPDTTETGLIEAAWPIAEKLGEVNNQQFDKAGAAVQSNTYSADVSFPSVTFPGEMLVITVEKDEYGNYKADPWSAYVEPAEWAADGLHAQYGPEVIGAKHDELANARITVTADEIRAFGCTAEIGSDEYKAAAAALYGEKLAEYYRGSLTEDTPFCCYDVRFVVTQESAIHQDSYDVVIAFRVRDILPFSYLFSYGPTYCNGTYYPGYEGWLVGSTLVHVDLAADGSFASDAYLNGAG